jgi:hypothetical protein
MYCEVRMRDDLVQKLFSLFTSSARAEAMAGDLIQERRDRGSTWFWWHAFVTAAALCGTAAFRDPLRTMALVAAGSALFTAPALAGVVAVSLFPGLLGSLVSWIVLSLFWWGGALWAGASVVVMAPTRGMAACVTLAALAEALLLALLLVGLPLDAGTGTDPYGIFYITAASAAVPLLVGGAVAHARAITWRNEPGPRA